MTYFTFTTTIEFFCFIIAVVTLIKDQSFVWRCMAIYMLITCLAEFSGVYIARNAIIPNNHWIYNLFLLSEIGFTSLMFWHLFDEYINAKPFIFAGLCITSLFYLGDLLNHGFFEYNEQTYTEMSVIFVLYSLYYFYLLLKQESYLTLKYYAPFWWAAGTLFFYFGATAVNVFDSKLDNVMVGKHHINFYIFRVLNVIQYGCWSYSFICRRWLTTTSKS